MRILHLTLKKKWFDMVASGEKKQEYRAIKSYWRKRLFDDFPILGKSFTREFDIVRFKNGYGKDAPTIDVEYLYTRILRGVEEWGAEPERFYYVIGLGDIKNKKDDTVKHNRYGTRQARLF